jgi:hypothetical protein
LKPLSLLLICASVALLPSCASQFKDITVDTKANPAVNVTRFSTYAWAGAATVIRDPEREWTPSDLDLGAEIRFLVDRELRNRGFSEVAVDPDVLAIYAVGVDMKTLNLKVDDDNTRRFEEVPMGGVMIILADPGTRQPFWAGAAEAELLEEPDRELTRQRLDYAISTMFARFPR